MAGKKLQEFIIESFEGGLNSRDVISQLSSQELFECLNMHTKGKTLRTRKGAKLATEFSLHDTKCEITPISAVSYIDQSGYKMFLVKRSDDIATYLRLLIVKTDCTCSIMNLKTIYHSDFEADISQIKCLSFSGKKTKSGGNYLLLSLVDENDNICQKTIYELNSTFNRFSVINSSDFYKPLVSINGRGNNYTQLPTYRKTFPASRRFEDFNLLSGGFRAGFTTDGLSTVFYLPANNLSANANENVIVDYTAVNGKNYLVEIAHDSNNSSQVQIGEETFVFVVDRERGEIKTTNAQGVETALPMSEANRNNLVITAYKQVQTDEFFRMSVAENFDSRVFLSGNKNQCNVVYFSRQNNPLYFPETNFAYFGESGSNIVALKQNNDRLLVFKAHQVGVCSSIKSSNFDADYVFKGGSTNQAIVEKITIKPLKTGIGCLYPETIMNCSNRLVFLGSDNRVYAVTTSSNYTHRFYRISDKIEAKLNEKNFSNAFCADDNGLYMLFVGNRCFAFDYNSNAFVSASSANGNKNSKDKIAWFYFEYNLGVAKPIVALSFEGKAMIVAKCAYPLPLESVFVYVLEGDYDQSVDKTLEVSDKAIQSSFSTGANEFNQDGRKNIVGVELTLTKLSQNFEDNFKLYYLNENKKHLASEILHSEVSNSEQVIKKTPCIFGVRHFGVGLETKGSFAIKQIKYFYKV